MTTTEQSMPEVALPRNLVRVEGPPNNEGVIATGRHGQFETLGNGLIVPGGTAVNLVVAATRVTSRRKVLQVGPEVKSVMPGETVIMNLDSAPLGTMEDGTEVHADHADHDALRAMNPRRPTTSVAMMLAMEIVPLEEHQ